ncbi:MAG: DNA repair protein RecN [Nocardioidaceae bacterium]
MDRPTVLSMLEELSIDSLGVIDAATLELGAGLNVVTGETGAGKTMVVTALNLLLGARADSGVVREHAHRARVQGTLQLDPESGVAARAGDAGADLDEGSLIVSRIVQAGGRSKASVGGAAIPVGTLAELSADLVVIHGQSDQQLLLQPAHQRRTLDAFGGPAHKVVSDEYRRTYEALRVVVAELAQVVSRGRERAQEADLLRLGLAEIEAVRPQPGEDERVLAEESRLAHADALRRAADEAQQALSADEPDLTPRDALGLVAAARKSLEAEREHDVRLAQLCDELAAASYALVDVAADLASYGSTLDSDPQRLAWVQERRATLGALTRKYGDTIADVLEWTETAAARLLQLDDDDSLVAGLRARRDELSQRLADLGADLSDRRRALAAQLSARVTDELSELAMPDADFTVDVTGLTEPRGNGLDEVTFLFAAHTGGQPRALQRGASGGELSRVMLALEVCLAGTQPVPTMIFDEVDAGVGGKAAVEIGRRLARLARTVQVIVVTHLPQVAAFADQHYLVVKSSDGSVTTSGVTRLDDEGRRRELSRMLAGLEDSDSALAHADELVDLARLERSS